MNKMKIAIKQTDDIAWIFEAAVDLSEATDADLQAIKAKKWYNKLLDTITFSKDDQIQIAKDIGSLAKLQEIIIRVLVMLSQENVAISTAVRQQAELLKGLSAKDTALLSALKKIKYGGTTQINFSDLDREKKVLIASLLIMADPTIQRNDYSKRYIGSILQIANVTALDNTVNPAAVDDLNREEQELLYRMIMVDRYLKDMDFEEPSEVIDEISIKPIRKKEIRASIIDTADAVTPEFFISYYERINTEYSMIEEDGILLDDGFDSNSNADIAQENISRDNLSKAWESIELTMKEIENTKFVDDALFVDYKWPKMIGDEYSTKAYALMMLEQELRKTYDVVVKTTNPSLCGNLASFAHDSAINKIDHSFNILRERIHAFITNTGFYNISDEMEAPLDATSFHEQIKNLLVAELRGNQFKYSLPPISHYVSLATVESDDMHFETGFLRVLEIIGNHWTYYTENELVEDYLKIQKEFANSANKIILRQLHSNVFKKIRSVYASIK